MAKKYTIGERAACKRCDQDIEWNGEHWWDRGGNRQCVPYRKNGEILIPKRGQKHQPYRD